MVPIRGVVAAALAVLLVSAGLLAQPQPAAQTPPTTVEPGQPAAGGGPTVEPPPAAEGTETTPPAEGNQTAPPPEAVAPNFDFEADAVPANWQATDAEARLAITHEAANVGGGKGALEATYSWGDRQGVVEVFAARNLAVPGGSVLSFRIRTSEPTSISFAVTEQDGSMYQGFLCQPAGAWSLVQARLPELQLMDNSQDEDGKLDVDQITEVSFQDLANLGGELERALGWKTGEQKMWLDDVTIDDRAVAGRVTAQDDTVVLDGFDTDAIFALPIRGAALEKAPGAPATIGTQSLRMGYRLGGGRYVGFVAGIETADLAGMKSLSLQLKSEAAARVVVVLEERDGSKYETALRPTGDNQWQKVDLPLELMQLSDDTTDENGQLDTDQLRVLIVVVDTFDADVNPQGDGAVYLDDVTAHLAAGTGPATAPGRVVPISFQVPG